MARTGIGAAYVQRQMAQGRSMASIQQEAASKGYTVGAAAQAMFSGGGGGGGGGSAPAPAPARTGIGAAYVQREMGKGRSLSDIQQEAASKGYQIGEKAQAMFNQGGSGSGGGGGGAYHSTAGGGSDLNWLKQYRGPQGGRDSTNFGAAALQRARDAGHSDADIQSAITSGGWNLGKAAQQALSSGGSVQDALKGQRNIWAHYSGSGGGWGAGANTRALAAGMTRPEIRSQLAESGLRIGEEAAKDLNVHAQQTTHIRPDDVKDKYNGYNTRYVMMPRDVRVTHLNYDEGDPRRYSTGVYAGGGYSDASLANFYGNFDPTGGDDGPYKHGTRGTYQDADWDYNIGGGKGVDSGRPNFYWKNANEEALGRHTDAWRGHGYDGRETSPTGYLSGRGDLPRNDGWTQAYQESLDAAAGQAEKDYNDTFRDTGNKIADTATSDDIATKVVEAEDSVLDKDGPVVDILKTGGNASGHPGTGAPRHLARGTANYYSSRFG